MVIHDLIAQHRRSRLAQFLVFALLGTAGAAHAERRLLNVGDHRYLLIAMVIVRMQKRLC
jgi:hypothetical protein